MRYQRVRSGNPTGNGAPSRTKTKNAVAGVGARNGAKQKVSTKKPRGNDTAPGVSLTSRMVAVIGRDGTVVGLFRRPAEVRAFLVGGCA
ncbi:hypothetical protein MBLL_03425 [Methylobacterium bullatum]|uniref:Uncharacterized protein n=1 Tax=Methylobacterium bullatum TaxID=570505 RepID=A0A679JUU9_9HYPH|nr:hypothetical protein MBLL_03425 [Methylobacterium bullatum]